MNVLVYSGPEVLPTSLSRTITLLRSTLYPNYTVQAITLQALSSAPWATTCALLVFPACRQHLALPSQAAASVKSFVESGGKFLGIRAALRIGGSAVGSGTADYSFRFQDPSTGSSIYCTFAYGDDIDARLVSLRPSSWSLSIQLLQSKSTHFENVSKTIIARYESDQRVAGAATLVGSGKVAAWGPHLETEITSENSGLAADVISQADSHRKHMFRATLELLRLKIPGPLGDAPSHPLPQFLLASPSCPSIVPRILQELSLHLPAKLEDEHDTFVFHGSSDAAAIVQQGRTASTSDDIRHVIVYTDGSLPSKDLTPVFDTQQYFADLSIARTKIPTTTWGFGEALFYGEAVTSTQTLLDKNPRFLSSLPSPVLSLATHQLAGRGRGGNSWVSPTGCLQFSLRLRVSLSNFQATRLVFIQYLFALAVVEACRDDGVLGGYGDRVRLKWPNDVYAVVEGSERKTTKVAGILVYTTFTGNDVDIVIGCGLNVLNPPPIASLASLLPPDADRELSLERTLAIVMAKFEPMWATFASNRGSFDPFMDLYLERWMHSDQVVTLTTTTPHRRVRIVGITNDHGLLRTIPESGGYSSSPDFIDLQPDGNTFDLMAGLIMTKTW